MHQVTGTWVGNIELRGETLFFPAELTEAGGAAWGEALANYALKAGDRVSFDYAAPSGRLRVEGRLEDDGAIRGTAQRDGERCTESGRVTLLRTAALDASALDDCLGIYSLEPGRWISISCSSMFLFYFDSATGRMGPLYPKSQDEFWAGPLRLVIHPQTFSARFERDAQGRVTALVWSEVDQPTRRGVRNGASVHTYFNEQRVTFSNGDVTLAGTLRIPKGAGPHPAVVLVHGSGPQTREGALGLLRFHAETFAQHGIASLTYDKRGTGQSIPGEWQEVGFAELAGDARACYWLLQQHPAIDPTRIGLWGISQGCWLSEIAAQQLIDAGERPPAFVVLVSGGGVDGTVQNLKYVERSVRADGYDEATVNRAVHIQRLKFEYAYKRTDDAWEDYIAAAQAAKDEPWFRWIDPPLERDHSAWDWWRTNNAFDPVPVLEALPCPILAILGARDTSTPPDETAAVFQAAFEGDPHKTVLIYEDADHVLVGTPTGSPSDWARSQGFAPGYLDDTLRWLREALSPSAPRAARSGVTRRDWLVGIPRGRAI